MQILLYTTLDQLASLAPHWDRLSRGVPFRSWAWTSNWWRHYGAGRTPQRRDPSLFILAALDRTGTPVAIAPWYRECSSSRGRVLRFLGSGEVCSDYLSVLCLPGMEDPVSRALADWLIDDAPRRAGRLPGPDATAWDLLELTGVDARDDVVGRLAEHLEAGRCTVHRRGGPNCWRIELPGSWDEYLEILSKPHRKRLRRFQRKLLDTGRAVLRSVVRSADLPRAEKILIDLHQERWRRQSEPGCYASPRFAAFHHDVMGDLLSSGQLDLTWLELDGKPVAAEYQMTGNGVVYAYQAGIDPQADEHSPGQLSCLLTLKRAIERGHRAFDFLRGDEPYKAHWRAQRRPSIEVRAAAPRAAAQLRHRVWLAGSRAKHWIKQNLKTISTNP